MEQYDIALIGGDARTAYMLPYLVGKGYRVICYGLSQISEMEGCMIEAQSLHEAIESSKYIVGGIPFLKGNLVSCFQKLPDLQVEELYRSLRNGQILFGGILPEEFIDVCEEKGVTCYDFMKNEPYVIRNAIATAEGSILEALQNQKTNIHGSRSLVLGYGRCGRALAQKLKGMDAKVSVCSQCEEELAYADSFGMKTVNLKDLKKCIEDYEYIYNTIPARILSRDTLVKIRKDALVIDIASLPGGVDDEAAERIGVKVLHCYGLPGKYAPKAVAEGLVEYVIQSIE